MWLKFAKVALLSLAVLATLAETADARRNRGGGWSSSNDPVYQTLEETTPYTGVTHLVMLTGYGVFPERTFAEYGDRILFVNKVNRTLSVQASNSSWKSGDIDPGDGYLIFVQPGTQTQFYAATYYSNSGITGDFKIHQTPKDVDYGNSAVPIDDLLTMVGMPSDFLTNILLDIGQLQIDAGITNGLVNRITGLLN